MIIKKKFGGLNTDIDPVLLPSGTATVALNVTVEDGDLKRRQGFSQWDSDVTGSADGVLNMFTARFSDGSTYVVCKCDDGNLWQRKIDPTPAASFTQITTEFSHNSSDRGWFFMWADRMHYFDRVGGSRWNPTINSGTAYKAGMPVPTDTFVAAQKNLSNPVGSKDGWYHFQRAWTNYATREESQCGPLIGSDTDETAIELRSDSSPSSGAAEMVIPAAPTAHEVDTQTVFSTLGNTEYIEKAVSNTPSFRAYPDVPFGAVGATISYHNGDHVLARRKQYTNAGGEPRGAEVGFYNGSQAVYGRVYKTVEVDQNTAASGSFIPGLIEFSIPEFPTMIPRLRVYYYGDSGVRGVWPKPWEGRLMGGPSGGLVAMVHGGGIACAFTPTVTWMAHNTSDGRIAFSPLVESKGCVADGAAVGTYQGIHSLGYRSWLAIGKDGFNDIAHHRFSTTLAEIPDDQQTDGRMGYYGFRDQVWAAVTKSGETVAQRILVWDMPTKSLVIFEPACFSASQAITAMVELAAPQDEPVMLVGTSTGEIFKYPSGTTDDGDGYVSTWKGFFAQESRNRNQRIDSVEVHVGSSVTDNVNWEALAYRTSSASPDAANGTFKRNDRLETLLTTFGKTDARMYSIEFESTAACTANWDIHGVVWKIGTTD